MKSMAGTALIILGVVIIGLGVFIKFKTGKSQNLELVKNAITKQEPQFTNTDNTPLTSEIIMKDSKQEPLNNQIRPSSSNRLIDNHKEEVNNSNDSYKKGLEFEKFVVQKFDKKYFKLKEWTSDKFVNGFYAENTKGPDLIYQFTLGKDISEGLAIECKWRNKLNDNFSIATAQQIKHYKDIEQERNIPVFIIIGIGGQPSNPEQLFIIPLNKITSSKLTKNFINGFKQEIDRNVFFDSKTKSLTAKSFNKVKVHA